MTTNHGNGSDYDKIVRRCVEGQIRSFLNDHPSIAEAVDWRFSHKTKADALISSLGKRVIRELTCADTRSRIQAALAQTALSRPERDG